MRTKRWMRTKAEGEGHVGNFGLYLEQDGKGSPRRALSSRGTYSESPWLLPRTDSEREGRKQEQKATVMVHTRITAAWLTVGVVKVMRPGRSLNMF